MTRKQRSVSTTDPPADDACVPALMTPRRLAGELERIALEVARQEHRLKRLAAYVDSQSFPALAETLGDVADGLAELGGRVLVGSSCPSSPGATSRRGATATPCSSGSRPRRAARTGRRWGSATWSSRTGWPTPSSAAGT
jgi:hypothetical protein